MTALGRRLWKKEMQGRQVRDLPRIEWQSQ